MYVYPTVYIWRLEDVSFCFVRPRDRTPVVRFGSKHLYLMSHLRGSRVRVSLPQRYWMFWDKIE